MGCLLGWLLGCLVGCLVGCIVGWLVGSADGFPVTTYSEQQHQGQTKPKEEKHNPILYRNAQNKHQKGDEV